MKRRIAALLIAGVITASGCQGGFALAAETETENQAETGTEESTRGYRRSRKLYERRGAGRKSGRVCKPKQIFSGFSVRDAKNPFCLPQGKCESLEPKLLRGLSRNRQPFVLL